MTWDIRQEFIQLESHCKSKTHQTRRSTIIPKSIPTRGFTKTRATQSTTETKAIQHFKINHWEIGGSRKILI